MFTRCLWKPTFANCSDEMPTPSTNSGIRDNYRRGNVADFLKAKVQTGSRLSVVSAYFTIYVYEALKDKLEGIEHLDFLFGEPRFIASLDPDKTEKKAFKIEDNELQLANVLQQKRVARECAEWFRQKVDIAYASILIGSKGGPGTNATARAHPWQPEIPLADFAEVLGTRSVQISQSELKPDGWRLESPAILRLLEKLRRAGKPLCEYVKGRFYYGIKTGLNEAFVVDRATRDRLIHEHKSSAEILKPFLRRRDVKRWRVEPQDLWLIFTRRGIDIKKYPAIYEHLLPLKKQLMPGEPNYLLGLLNSKVLWWFIRQTAANKQGDFYEFKPMYVSVLPIPAVPTEKQKPVERLVERILKAKQSEADRIVCSTLEREIDQQVYALYGLTPAEIKIVEGQTK